MRQDRLEGRRCARGACRLFLTTHPRPQASDGGADRLFRLGCRIKTELANLTPASRLTDRQSAAHPAEN
jgi:hypothetical protein